VNGVKGVRLVKAHRHMTLTALDRRLPRFLHRTQKNKAEDVQKWYEQKKFKDHGFSFYFDRTRENSSYPYIKDRYTVGEYMCALSPKLRYLCKVVFKCLFGKDRSKLLVFI